MSNGGVPLMVLLVQLVNNGFNLRSQLLTVF